jgi:ankyrin repeat protein
MMRELLTLGATIESTNEFRETPIIVASTFGHSEAVRLLIQSGIAISN